MPIDRLDADHEHLRDLLRAVGLCDELEHLELSRSEHLALLFAAAGLLEVVANERGDRGGIDERLPAHRRPACLDEVAVRRGLQDVAGRTCLERLEQVLLVVVHREHQQTKLRPAS